MLFLDYFVYFLVALLLLLLTGRIGSAAILGTIAFMTHAVMNMFVHESRGYGIRTTDIAAARTAMNVASEYKLVIHAKTARALLLAICLISLGIHSFFSISLRMRGILLVIAVLLAAACCLLLWNDRLMNRLKVRPYLFDPAGSCRDHGAALEVLAGVPYLMVRKPEGYSQSAADSLRAKGAAEGSALYSSAETKTSGKGLPDIIVIMNESYSDLTNCGTFETDRDNMEYFYSLKDNVVRGKVTVPVQGGYTANTEFEFLTGFAHALLPAGVISFMNYVKEKTPSVNSIFKENGYYSIFMHPFLKSGWNREEVYKDFLFDKTYWEEDFEGRDRIRGYVSDKGDYEELIARYEEAAKTNEHVFLFNVTMQNHGGYRAEGYEPTVHLKGLQGNYPEAEQYLSLIKESSDAVKVLIDHFSKSERPVLICMFGDHTPAVEDAFYDEISKKAGYDAFEKGVRMHQTPFLIYANYDIEEAEYENMSANYLPTLVLDLAGLPKNEWFAYQADMYRKYPVLSLYGAKDSAGKWLPWEEACESQEVKNFAIVQYKELFDKY